VRPLQIGIPSATGYNEAAELNVKVDYAPGSGLPKKAKIEKTKRELGVMASDTITAWIAAGCKFDSKQKIEFPNAADAAKYEACKGGIKAKQRDWGDARRSLIDSVGQYCSYCESPILSHLHIEHRAPKRTFPARSLSWSNFLLACSTCNSAKGHSPSQANLPGHPLSTAAAENYIDNVGAVRYIWPSFDWAPLPLHSPYPFSLSLNWITPRNQKLGKCAALTDPERQRMRDMFALGQLDIDGGLYYEPWGTALRFKKHFGLFVIANPACDKINRDAADNVINLVGLNRILRSSKSSDSVDRRMQSRMLAWFRAHEMRDLLSEAVIADGAAPAGKKRLPLVLEQLKITMRSTGFWLVWLSVLGGGPAIAGSPVQNILRDMFKGTAPNDWPAI
jgi:hypothetical protein